MSILSILCVNAGYQRPCWDVKRHDSAIHWIMLTTQKLLIKVSLSQMNTPDRRKHSMCVLASFPVAVIKYSNKSNLREERFVSVHSSRIWPVVMEKQRQQELEAAAHTTSTVRKQLLLSSLLHLHSPGSQLGEWCHPQWAGLPTSVNLIDRACPVTHLSGDSRFCLFGN